MKKDSNVSPDPEVQARPTRRVFSRDYKQKIIGLVDACDTPQAVGALLRQEGLYSSYLGNWRRELGEEDARSGGGRKQRTPTKAADTRKENKQLKRDIKRLAEKLRQAELIIDVQKKLSELLAMSSTSRSCTPSS